MVHRSPPGMRQSIALGRLWESSKNIPLVLQRQFGASTGLATIAHTDTSPEIWRQYSSYRHVPMASVVVVLVSGAKLKGGAACWGRVPWRAQHAVCLGCRGRILHQKLVLVSGAKWRQTGVGE